MSDQQDRVNQVLEAADGDKIQAAKALNMPADKLSDIILRSPKLRNKWASRTHSDPPPPSKEQSSLHPTKKSQPPPEVPALKDKEELAKAVEENKDKLDRGLRFLELDKDAKRLAGNFSRFSKRHFAEMVNITGGGAMRIFMQLNQMIDFVKEKLENEELYNGGEEEVAQLQTLFNSFLGLCNQAQKFATFASEAALTQAKIDALKKSGGKNKDRGKPGFSPLAIKADSVTINESPSPKN